MRLKKCDSHLTCKVANEYLNVRVRVEVVEWNKMVPTLSLLPCKSSVSVKENSNRKKKQKNSKENFLVFFNVNLDIKLKHKKDKKAIAKLIHSFTGKNIYFLNSICFP